MVWTKLTKSWLTAPQQSDSTTSPPKVGRTVKGADQMSSLNKRPQIKRHRYDDLLYTSANTQGSRGYGYQPANNLDSSRNLQSRIDGASSDIFPSKVEQAPSHIRTAQPATLRPPPPSNPSDDHGPTKAPHRVRKQDSKPARSTIAQINGHLQGQAAPRSLGMTAAATKRRSNPQELGTSAKRIKLDFTESAQKPEMANGQLTTDIALKLDRFQMGQGYATSSDPPSDIHKLRVTCPITNGKKSLKLQLSGMHNAKRFDLTDAALEKVMFTEGIPPKMVCVLNKARSVAGRPEHTTKHFFYEFDSEQKELVEKVKKEMSALGITIERLKVHEYDEISKPKRDKPKSSSQEALSSQPPTGPRADRLSSINSKPATFKSMEKPKTYARPRTGSSGDLIPRRPAKMQSSADEMVISDDEKGKEKEGEEKSKKEEKNGEVEVSPTAFYGNGKATDTPVLFGGTNRATRSTFAAESSRPKRTASMEADKKAARQKQQQEEEERIVKMKETNRRQNMQEFGSPFSHTFSLDNKSETITLDDFHRLSEYEYLNDTLINFFLKYSIDKLSQRRPEDAKNVYLFNTYFYQRFTEGGKNGYDNVKRWTAKVDLFQYKYIIVPINYKMHWFVAIIYNLPKLLETQAKKDQEDLNRRAAERVAKQKEKQNEREKEKGEEIVVEDFDEEDDGALVSAARTVEAGNRRTRNSGLFGGPTKTSSTVAKPKPSRPPLEDPEEGTCIYVLDSLRSGTGHNNVQAALKSYLISEAKERKGVDIDRGLIYGSNPPCPQQDNYCDCGVFIVHYAETFLRGPENFAQVLHEAKSRGKSDPDVKQNLQKMWREDQLPSKRRKLRELILAIKPEDTRPPPSDRVEEKGPEPHGDDGSKGNDESDAAKTPASEFGKLRLNGNSTNTSRAATPGSEKSSSTDTNEPSRPGDKEGDSLESEDKSVKEDEDDVIMVDERKLVKERTYRRLTRPR